jgi:Holliday junction resolvase
MDADDFIVENILQPKKKATINSGDKGKRNERILAKILKERFGDGFSRSIGSGNRVWQVSNMPKHAQDTFSGDLVCPEDFLWVFECKSGYNDIDLNAAFEDGHTELDAFLKQAEEEKRNSGRNPMLCWKKDRKGWLAFMHTNEMPKDVDFEYQLKYREWTGVSLELLLKKTPDSFWRKGKDKNG